MSVSTVRHAGTKRPAIEAPPEKFATLAKVASAYHIVERNLTNDLIRSLFFDKQTVLLHLSEYTYIGNAQNCMPHGNGRLFRPDGTLCYEGEFQLGKRHGAGSLYAADGIRKIFTGIFAQDLSQGPGTFFYNSGNKRMTVDCVNNIPQGTGTMYYEGGAVAYTGQILYPNMHGEGRLYAASGQCLYQGSFMHGKRSGFGETWTAQGIKIYEGEYLGDKRHGQGTSFDQTTGMVKFKGRFENGEPTADGLWHTLQGEEFVDIIN